MTVNLKMMLAIIASTAVFSAAYAADLVKIETSMGDITVELDRENAPQTVANFLDYANSGHYDRTIIHRVVTGYVIQGGGFSKYFNERPLRDPIPYEGDNGLKNLRGAIAMARGDSRDSAQSQWFINVKDNPELDHKIFEGAPLYGYSVFGRVIDGLDVVDAIAAVETGPGGDFVSEVPIEPIIVMRVDLAQ